MYILRFKSVEFLIYCVDGAMMGLSVCSALRWYEKVCDEYRGVEAKCADISSFRRFVRAVV